MASRRFELGDRVRHARRPEWGTGAIVKAEDTSVNGRPAQRLAVRFSNAGLKTVSTIHAELELVTPEANGVAEWDRVRDSDWLGGVAQRKVGEAMVALAAEVRDPFSSLRQRLAACLALYRFDRSGRSLVDWAVAQSGMEDPLSRFTRHELEHMYEQWASQRENHLARLLQEARADRALVQDLLRSAPRDAVEAVRRHSAER